LFPVRLLTYDLPWQYIINPDSKGPYSGFLTGLGHMTADPEGYAAWMRSGGAERVFADRSKSAFIKRVMQGHEDQSLGVQYVERGQDAVRCADRMDALVSTPLRLGRYTKGMQQGETPLRAAVASSEAAFHRPGYGGPVGKAWNTIVPYTTAHLNGMEKSVRALLRHRPHRDGVEYSAPGHGPARRHDYAARHRPVVRLQGRRMVQGDARVAEGHRLVHRAANRTAARRSRLPRRRFFPSCSSPCRGGCSRRSSPTIRTPGQYLGRRSARA
jgi:hypothetical protein